jgi:predicted phosphohydrolase
MRLAWLTDIHLNFASPRAFDVLCDAIDAERADVVLLGGDIGEAPDFAYYLQALEARLQRPIHFVLGNHDYYHGPGIAAVRAGLPPLCARFPRLCWLGGVEVVPLTLRTALVGHDGWADGRLGDYRHSGVLLNDYRLIPDLTGISASERLERLNALGDEAARHLRRVTAAALRDFERVVVLTHVPPFREACWHEGAISSDDYLPHFACGAAGVALVEALAEQLGRSVLVLCGHTHSSGEAEIVPGLRVLTGAAEYGRPVLQKILEVD